MRIDYFFILLIEGVDLFDLRDFHPRPLACRPTPIANFIAVGLRIVVEGFAIIFLNYLFILKIL